MINKKYTLTITNLTKEEAKELSEHFAFGSILWIKEIFDGRNSEILKGYLGDSEVCIVEQDLVLTGEVK